MPKFITDLGHAAFARYLLAIAQVLVGFAIPGGGGIMFVILGVLCAVMGHMTRGQTFRDFQKTTNEARARRKMPPQRVIMRKRTEILAANGATIFVCAVTPFSQNALPYALPLCVAAAIFACLSANFASLDNSEIDDAGKPTRG